MHWGVNSIFSVKKAVQNIKFGDFGQSRFGHIVESAQLSNQKVALNG